MRILAVVLVLAGAAANQPRLGRYYAERIDQIHTVAALGLADEVQAPSRHPAGSRFSGNYYGREGRTLHTWEFHGDGTFLHSWIISGAGTSVRNSERGTFRLQGDTLEIALTSSASGFVTPGVGGRTTQAGGNAEPATQTRRLKVQLDKGTLAVLDGIPMKPKTW
jgi:hypothetical protein